MKNGNYRIRLEPEPESGFTVVAPARLEAMNDAYHKHVFRHRHPNVL